MSVIAAALSEAVSTILARVVRLHVDTWASISVAVGTLVLAFFTYKAVRATRNQLKWEKAREVSARYPRLFLKDIWIPAPPKKNGSNVSEGVAIETKNGRVHTKLKTKNIANLGLYAVAIHKVCIVDGQFKASAWSYPMAVISPGNAWREHDGVHAFVTAISPEGSHLDGSAIIDQAHQLVLEFRSGADSGRAWAMVLPRVKHDPEKRLAAFAGQGAKPVLVSRLPEDLQATLAEPDHSRPAYSAD